MSANFKDLDKLVDWADLEKDAVHCTENAKGFFSIFADDPSSEDSENLDLENSQCE